MGFVVSAVNCEIPIIRYFVFRVDKMSVSKVVVVGDENVGKSCLIVTHSTGTFPHDRIPIILSISSACTDENAENIFELIFYDTFGAKDFDFVRHYLYTGADAFLICFSLVDHSSFQSVLSRWTPEVRKQYPRTPIILVGLKLDMRRDTEIHTNGDNHFVTIDSYPYITYSQGLSMANAIGAAAYVECSALTNTGLSDLSKLMNHIIRGRSLGTSNLEMIEERRSSSLGNYIMAAVLLLLVFIVLFTIVVHNRRKKS